MDSKAKGKTLLFRVPCRDPARLGKSDARIAWCAGSDLDLERIRTQTARANLAWQAQLHDFLVKKRFLHRPGFVGK